MPRKQLRKQLAQLQSELEATDAMDGDERLMLMQLMQDITETLDRTRDHAVGTGERPEAVLVDPLTERITGAMTQLEDTHPTVSFALRRVIDLLGRMGI